MALIFAVRGTQLDAYYSSSGKTPGTYSNDANGQPAVVAGTAGSFGSSDISMTLASATARRGLVYPGLSNWTNNDAFAVQMRWKPNYTGSTAQGRGLWMATGGNISVGFGTCHLYHDNAGKFNFWISRCSDGLDALATTTNQGWGPVAGQYYDITLSYDGTAANSSVIISVDGGSTFFEARTPTRARTGSNNKLTPSIMIGGTYNQAGGNGSLNEFLVFDNATSAIFVARTVFQSTVLFDGQLNINPGTSNVRALTSYTLAGVPFVGSAAIPTAAQVEVGVPVDLTVGTLLSAATLLDTEVETGFTMKQSLRLMNAALAGKVSGAGTTTVSIRDLNDTKDRVVATVDANGNRTDVTKDVT